MRRVKLTSFWAWSYRHSEAFNRLFLAFFIAIPVMAFAVAAYDRYTTHMALETEQWYCDAMETEWRTVPHFLKKSTKEPFDVCVLWAKKGS